MNLHPPAHKHRADIKFRHAGNNQVTQEKQDEDSPGIPKSKCIGPHQDEYDR